MSEDKISVEAERFVGMILAAKLGKQAGEDMVFECSTRTGRNFVFKSVEAIGGDWLRISSPDVNDRHVRAGSISEWNEVEIAEPVTSQSFKSLLQNAQNKQWVTDGKWSSYADSNPTF